jgi:hypothetical protein
VIFILALSAGIVEFASAQEACKLCVAKQFYQQGEAVVISGKVDAVLENTPIIIQIYFNQNLVDIAQVDVAQDGSFTHSVIAEGPYWKSDGKYTVKATYGVTGNVYEASFDFQTKESASTTTEIFEVRAGDSGTFDVPYAIKGGTIKDVIVDTGILGLVVTIQADNDGSITLDLGRKWIDAKKADGTDDTYIILIDGLEVPYQETVNAESRLVTIQFQEGDSDIEIIGTTVIPEFGQIALIILVTAISSMIFISKRVSVPKLS